MSLLAATASSGRSSQGSPPLAWQRGPVRCAALQQQPEPTHLARDGTRRLQGRSYGSLRSLADLELTCPLVPSEPAPSRVYKVGNMLETLKGETVTVQGYFGGRVDVSALLSFARLRSEDQSCFLKLVWKGNDSTSPASLKNIREWQPVRVRGYLKSAKAVLNGLRSRMPIIKDVELHVTELQPLNDLSADTQLAQDTVYSAAPHNLHKRHLQLRTCRELRDNLKTRSTALQAVRRILVRRYDFDEIETPMLFKPTPEGAREFLVPTRTKGLAYALSQSPQQYKQILMGSGIPRYFQLARCFRDEDLRADRQPEFTQVSMCEAAVLL